MKLNFLTLRFSKQHKILSNITLFLFLISTLIVSAQKPQRIAYIDMEYILENVPEYMEAQNTLDSKVAKWRGKLDKLSRYIEKIKNDLANERAILTNDLILDKEDEITLKQEELRRLESLYFGPNGDMFLLRKQLVKPIQDQVFNSIEGIVKKKKYDFVFDKSSELEKKLIHKFAKNFKFDDEFNDENKARIIDLYLKENIYISESGNDELKELKKVLTSKTANETGIVKLYIALFKKFDITHEMVLTTNRLELKFDKEFEATTFLQEFLFYFPASKKYLAPSKFGTRFGFPPPYYMDNYGLFVTGYDINGKRKAFSEVKYIESLPANSSKDEMFIDVSFHKEDFTKNTIKIHRKLHGYYAMNIQPFMNLIQPDRKNEVIDDAFAKSSDKNAEVLSRELIHEDPSLFGLKPFEVTFDLRSEYFVEKAGTKFLFKIGALIGPQMEMYQEKKRILPLEAEFNRSYYRTLKITIPEGYKVSNLDDITIKNSYTKDGKELFIFDSYYSLEGNILTVTADEHYRETLVAPELFEAYRTVINSAADFNKVTLVLEPM